MEISVKIIDMNGNEIPRLNNYALVKNLIDNGQAMITCAMPFTIQLLDNPILLLTYPFDLDSMTDVQKNILKEAAIALLDKL